MLLYCFYCILLKTVLYRSDPFQMDIAYRIRTEQFTEPNRTEPLKKTGVDIRLNVLYESYLKRLGSIPNSFNGLVRFGSVNRSVPVFNIHSKWIGLVRTTFNET